MIRHERGFAGRSGERWHGDDLESDYVVGNKGEIVETRQVEGSEAGTVVRRCRAGGG